VSTGEFVSTTSTTEGLASTLLRCAPKEILLPDTWNDEHLDDKTYSWVKQLDDCLPSSSMRTYRPVESFMGHVKVSAAIVKESKVHESELRAAAAIVDYVAFTRLSQSMGSSVREPQHLESSDHMIIDASAWKGLEIAKSLSGTKQSSLLHCIDETVTPAGSRLLMVSTKSHGGARILN
jgi:DNA mismatch repair protein MutS